MNLCITKCPDMSFVSGTVCTSCISPCLNCVNTSTTCLSCQSGFNSLTLTTLQCVTQCPSNSYLYQSTCILCASSCSQCNSNGCLQCSPQYYSSPGKIINGVTYYECYSSCPQTLPFLINSTCQKCSLNCLQCDTIQCLQCSSNYSGYEQYCLLVCPPSYVSLAGICVLPSTITNNTTNSSISASSSNSTSVPIPFSIVTLILVGCIFISKLMHNDTLISLAIFSVISVLSIICNLVYLIRKLADWGGLNSSSNYAIVLIVGLLINYVANVLFIFVAKHTLLKDESFICWKRGNVQLIKD